MISLVGEFDPLRAAQLKQLKKVPEFIEGTRRRGGAPGAPGSSAPRLAAQRTRWLVTGSCGQLGAHVVALLRSRSGGSRLGETVSAVCTGSHPGDCVSDEGVNLLIPGTLAALLRRVRPTHVLHLAGIASPAVAQQQAANAWWLHHSLTAELARYAADTQGWLGFPSTDFIFDGTAARAYRESDHAAPVNLYGRTKQAGEGAVLGEDAGAVVRLSLLYGRSPNGRPNVVARQLDSLKRGETVDSVIDEVRTPLAFTDAAAILVRLGERAHRGLLHLGGPDAVTPQELLHALARCAGVPPRTRPISRTALSVTRPRNVSLDATLIRRLLPDLAPGPIPGLAHGRAAAALEMEQSE